MKYGFEPIDAENKNSVFSDYGGNLTDCCRL